MTPEERYRRQVAPARASINAVELRRRLEKLRRKQVYRRFGLLLRRLFNEERLYDIATAIARHAELSRQARYEENASDPAHPFYGTTLHLGEVYHEDLMHK